MKPLAMIRYGMITPDKSVYWKTIFFISHQKHMLWVLKRTVSMIGKEIIAILCFKKLFNWPYGFQRR